jgi:hypothetical protein
MLHLKLRKIPEKHIVKHWIKDAWDVLPENSDTRKAKVLRKWPVLGTRGCTSKP